MCRLLTKGQTFVSTSHIKIDIRVKKQCCDPLIVIKCPRDLIDVYYKFYYIQTIRAILTNLK